MTRSARRILLGMLSLALGCGEVVVPERPEAPVASRAEASSPPAEELHRGKLLEKVPPGFTVVHQPPFFVVGDEPASVVRRRAVSTVEWAVDKLKAEYFSKDPEEILDVWLFKDKESYEKYCRTLFGETPSTPFGYYSEAHGALIMNISTGGGTLVHEIVHPFLKANFPRCPAWFNEGLASLYEQSAERGGRIRGLENWRLPGLQKAIRSGGVPRFRELTSTTTFQFYRKDRGTNYAQARYLCFFLQEKGLLRRFYREFRDGVDADPTGYETLKRVLGEDDMDAFQKRWETFVLGLRFR